MASATSSGAAAVPYATTTGTLSSSIIRNASDRSRAPTGLTFRAVSDSQEIQGCAVTLDGRTPASAAVHADAAIQLLVVPAQRRQVVGVGFAGAEVPQRRADLCPVRAGHAAVRGVEDHHPAAAVGPDGLPGSRARPPATANRPGRPPGTQPGKSTSTPASISWVLTSSTGQPGGEALPDLAQHLLPVRRAHGRGQVTHLGIAAGAGPQRREHRPGVLDGIDHHQRAAALTGGAPRHVFKTRTRLQPPLEPRVPQCPEQRHRILNNVANRHVAQRPQGPQLRLRRRRQHHRRAEMPSQQAQRIGHRHQQAMRQSLHLIQHDHRVRQPVHLPHPRPACGRTGTQTAEPSL